MGVHISVYNINSDSPVKDAAWNWLRHAGDREFASTEEFASTYIERDGLDLWRPASIPEARAWVERTVEAEGNRKRLFDILARMEADPDLWFHSSW